VEGSCIYLVSIIYFNGSFGGVASPFTFPPVTRLGHLEGMRGQLTWDLTWRFLETRGGWCSPFLTVLALDPGIVSWVCAVLPGVTLFPAILASPPPPPPVGKSHEVSFCAVPHGAAISMERYSCRWNAIRCSVMFSEQVLRCRFGGLERKIFVAEEATTAIL